MAHLDAGAPSFEDGDRITLPVAAGIDAGKAVTFDPNAGHLVKADGSNGFTGILGLGTNGETGVTRTAVQIQGIVAALLNTGTTPNPGNALEVAASANLQVKTDGSGNPVQAGPGELQVLPTEDESANVFEVRLP